MYTVHICNTTDAYNEHSKNQYTIIINVMSYENEE